MVDSEPNKMDFEYEDSLNSDEEADRVRKMKGQGNVTINKEEEILEKYETIKKIFNQNILARMPPESKKKNVSWLERLDITSDKKVEMVSSEITDDIQREVAFYNITLGNVKTALTKLKGMNQRLMRPNDYLVEMYKDDDVMQKIRSNLVRQQVKIQNFEERKLRRDNKKFQKKLQKVKLFEKSREKKRNLDAINKWKEEIKQKGENAADLSDFLKKDPGRPGRAGKARNDKKEFSKRQVPKGGKKKIAKRPGKAQRTNNRNKKGSKRR